MYFSDWNDGYFTSRCDVRLSWSTKIHSVTTTDVSVPFSHCVGSHSSLTEQIVCVCVSKKNTVEVKRSPFPLLTSWIKNKQGLDDELRSPATEELDKLTTSWRPSWAARHPACVWEWLWHFKQCLHKMLNRMPTMLKFLAMVGWCITQIQQDVRFLFDVDYSARIPIAEYVPFLFLNQDYYLRCKPALRVRLSPLYSIGYMFSFLFVQPDVVCVW